MTTLQFKVVQRRLSVPSAAGALQHLHVGAVCRLTPLKPFKSSKARIAMAMPPQPTKLENILMLKSRHLTPFQRRKISSLLTDGFIVLSSLSCCHCVVIVCIVHCVVVVRIVHCIVVVLSLRCHYIVIVVALLLRCCCVVIVRCVVIVHCVVIVRIMHCFLVHVVILCRRHWFHLSHVVSFSH